MRILSRGCVHCARLVVGVNLLMAAGARTPSAQAEAVDSAPAPAQELSAEVDDPLALADLSLDQLAQQSVFVAEPMVTTVSRVEERISDSPGSVYSFSRETILKRGYRSLRELLQVVPGFTVFHRDLQYVAGVRGLNANDNEKITLLINGQYFNGMNEPEYLNGPINLDNVERVEVVVGPSSFFQQANTLAATVNVITRNVEGMEAIVSTGNALPYSVTVMGGRRWAEDDSLSLSFTTEKKDGFDAWDSTFRPNLAGRDLTGELEQPNFFGVLTRQYGEWSAQAVAFQTTSPELLITNGDPRNNGQFSDMTCSILLRNEHPYSDVLTRIVTASAIYKHQGRTNQGGPPVPETGLEQVLSQMQYFGEVGLRYTGLRRHMIQVGVQLEYENNFQCYFSTVDRDPNTNVVTVFDRTPLIDRDTQAIGIYLDDEIQVTDRLKLIGGVRQDRNTLLPGDEWYTGIRSAIVFQTTEALGDEGDVQPGRADAIAPSGAEFGLGHRQARRAAVGPSGAQRHGARDPLDRRIAQHLLRGRLPARHGRLSRGAR